MTRKNLVVGVLLLLLCLCVTPVYAITDIKYQNVKTPKIERIKDLTGTEISNGATIGNREFIITADVEEIKLFESKDEPIEYYGEQLCHRDSETGMFSCYYYAPNYSFNYSTDGVKYQKTSLAAVAKKVLNITIDENHRPDISTLYSFNDLFYIIFTIEHINRQAGEKPTYNYETYILKTADGINYSKVNIPQLDYYNDYNSTKFYRYNDTFIIASAKWGDEATASDSFIYYTSNDLVTWTKQEIANSVFGLKEIYYTNIDRINEDGVIFCSSDNQNDKIVYINTTDFKNYNIYTKPDELDTILDSFNEDGSVPVYDYYKSTQSDDYNLFLFFYNDDSTIKLVHYKDYRKKEYKEYNFNLFYGASNHFIFKDNKLFFSYNLDDKRNLVYFDVEKEELKIVDLLEPIATDYLYSEGYYFSDDGKYIIFPSANGFMKMSLEDLFNAEEINYIPGDINGDEEISLTDVLMSLKMYFNDPNNMTEAQKSVADLNKDGKYDLTDILMLLKTYFSTSK